jgi:hypothetical protein
MRPRADKDLTPLVIARTLAIFAVVLGVGTLGLVVATRAGLPPTEPGTRLVAALAALLSLVCVVGHRHD